MLVACSTNLAHVPEPKQPQPAEDLNKPEFATTSNFRGWSYLVSRLNQDGIDYPELLCVYQDPRMPEFEHIPFTLRPKESPSIYVGFTTERLIRQAFAWMQSRQQIFDKVETHFKVTRFIITAILLIETRLGEATGNDLVINRLSRLAAIGAPGNLTTNFLNLSSRDPKVKFDELVERARYLESTFYPEVLALFQLAEDYKVDVLELRGSKAGAFGIPQFLPTSFIKFARDGNGDGHVSLFDEMDAIWSVANYLSSYGWQENAPLEKKRHVLWRYNRSDPYIETLLKIAVLLKHRQGLKSHSK